MSGALAALSTAVTLGGPALQASGIIPAWIRHPRKIGDIIPDCVIEEQHSDKVQVTQHPVATGSPISDHVYDIPMSLTMRLGWTNANLVGATFEGIMSGGLTGGLESAWSSFTESRVKEIYEKVVTLMRAHQTIDVVTGKRTYKNMLIVDISTKTDHTTEYALFLDVHFQEVIRVETLSTTQPAMSNQPLANRTAATTNGTAQQPIPKPKSSLSRTLNYVAPNNPNPWNPVTGGPS